jgi:hypothetical protein
MNEKISFWLIPSEEDRVFYQELINRLAVECDAPLFTPHVTIYSGLCGPQENADDLIRDALRGVNEFSLQIDKIIFSEKYTKSLFVQLEESADLVKMSTMIQNACLVQSDYRLDPHLSLMYKTMSNESKKKMANSIKLPGPEIKFNEVRAMSTPDPVLGREDVERWQEKTRMSFA